MQGAEFKVSYPEGSWGSHAKGYLAAFRRGKPVDPTEHVDEFLSKLASLARAAPDANYGLSRWGPDMAAPESPEQAKRRFMAQKWPLLSEIVCAAGCTPLVNMAPAMGAKWVSMNFQHHADDEDSHLSYNSNAVTRTPACWLVVSHIADGGSSWWMNAKSSFWWQMVVKGSTLNIYKICGTVGATGPRLVNSPEHMELSVPMTRVDWRVSNWNHGVEKYSQSNWSGMALSLIA